MALLEQAGVPAGQLRFMRVQSSHCEAQDFNGILSGLDHDLLLHLALDSASYALYLDAKLDFRPAALEGLWAFVADLLHSESRGGGQPP